MSCIEEIKYRGYMIIYKTLNLGVYGYVAGDLTFDIYMPYRHGSSNFDTGRIQPFLKFGRSLDGEARRDGPTIG